MAFRWLLLVLTLLAASSGCVVVKPWERGMLAERAMNPQAADEAARAAFDRHIFDVREGATGGTGSAGGGCGCN